APSWRPPTRACSGPARSPSGRGSVGRLDRGDDVVREGPEARPKIVPVVAPAPPVPVTVRAEKRPRKSEEPARRSGRALIYRPETAAQRAARSSRFASPSAGRSDSASAGRRSGHATILVRRGFARGLLIVGVVLPLIADRGKWSRRPPRIRKMV